jgi:nicotinate-nucleotide pyrophosphorylase (carboxylating)
MQSSTVDALLAAGLDAPYVEELARATLAEDLAGGVDVTSTATIALEATDSGELIARAAGTVAGLPVAAAVFDLASDGAIGFTALVKDGDRVARGDVLATLAGPARALLTAERSALNLLCHASGVATVTRTWADALAGTAAVVRDTRKTTPGLRALEKYAVRCGGGQNHRMSLSDQALVKDNHILAAGGVVAAFEAVRRAHPGLAIEVECATPEQVGEVVRAGADLVLLDNMTTGLLAESVRLARQLNPDVRLEASGTLTLDRAAEVAATGVDYLSVGALTHSAPVLDIALDLRAR